MAVLLGELDDACAVFIEQVLERSLSYELKGCAGESTPGTLEHRVHQLDDSSHLLAVGCCSLDRHHRLLHLIRELQNSLLEFVYDARPGQRPSNLVECRSTRRSKFAIASWNFSRSPRTVTHRSWCMNTKP